MKVLLIESDDAFAHELAAAIEARGLEARITGDGKEAVDLVRADRPDCIVLCVELPGMSGYSVCNKLKKDDDLRSIPLIIISAEATQETFETHRKLKSRAEGYLIKPFAPDALIGVMGSILTLPPEPEEAGEVVSLGEEVAAPVAQEDDDLRLLDEAFENIATEGAGAEAEVLVEDAAPAAELDAEAGQEIDRLGEEADAALAALGAEEASEADLASAAALFDEEPPAAAPEPPPAPAPRPAATPRPGAYAAVVAPPPAAHAPAHAARGADGRAEALEAELGQLRAELEASRAALAERGGELEALRADAASRESELRAREGDLQQRLRAHEQELQGHRAGADQAADASRRWTEERATFERDLRAALDRAQAAEGRARAESERAHQAEDRAHHAEERARAAEAKARAAEGRVEAAEAKVAEAEQVTRDAEARAATAEQETANLKLKLEEADQASSLQRAEADQARQRAEALAQELDAAAARAAEHERGLAALRPELDGARQELAAARAEVDGARLEAERTLGDLRRRVSELESQNAKHEERVVKAYQKIKGDEKIREKTRKALAIALQLLEERAGAAPAADVQARRE